MTEAGLLKQLIVLEEALHKKAVRQDNERMQALLHPDFEEIGRSGNRYSRAQVLDLFSKASEFETIQADNYELALLSSDVCLLTYYSVQVDKAGRRRWPTLRASVWIKTARGYQLRFHQGTAVAGSQ